MTTSSSPQGRSHETFYENYNNHGYHASEGGVIHINHYQLSLEGREQRYPLLGGISHRRSQEHPKRRLTTAEASADPNRSKKQRTEDFVNITLDVAKQFPGFGNPLKAALTGMRALVAHYEEFRGVKETIDGLPPQLDRIKQHIGATTIEGDLDETRRRRELTSSLGEIERRSWELLEKGRATRFVNKERDSSEVARLVEQFQEAITHFQVSQQQAIYNRITDLSSSFNALLKLQEMSPAVKDKLDSVMARLDRLCSTEDNIINNEHKRRTKLFNTLRVIADNGNILYNRINVHADKDCEDDIQAISGIAEDIRDALLDYQMSQQHAIYDQNCQLIDAADLAVLNNCRRACGAAYQHGGRRGCLRGTREAVLNEVESWTEDFDKSPVFWLNGLAGTGKSTIAQTIAERAFADGILGASFFCSRDFKDRSDLHFIFPTLAFQLAHKFSEFRAHLVPLLRSNPDIVDESLYSQMERLIIEPLRLTEISTVIVVDAIDECKDDEPSSAILSVLGRLVDQIPRVKFFITGRPEPRIKTGFRLPLLEDATKVFVLHDVHPDLINNDIILFLRHELSGLARRHRLDGWPSDEHINLLCQRAAGLFVYAVATVKFLDSKNYLPERRLDVIINLPECTTPEGTTQFKPRTTLDSLYMSVLQMAFSGKDPEVDCKVRSIIGTVVLLINPLPPSGIAEFTNMDPREVMLLLTSVQSLLILDEDLNQPVKSFHKSFPDFITDGARCVDTRFYISPGKMHFQLAVNCLRVMNNGLERNLLSLPDYALNSEVMDLQTRIDGRIGVALHYACLSWHNHLGMSQENVTEVISRVRTFLEEKFLAWLEVLSVLKATRGAVVALEKLITWLQKVSVDNQLLNTARECLYFVSQFFEPINASATHIYHSALELSPLSSIIRKLHYHRRLTPFPRVEVGIPDSRGLSVAISCQAKGCAWSPCGQFVAIREDNAVKIRDAMTLELVSTLQPATRRPYSPVDPPSYSPDGHSLACITSTGIIVWDIQTGGVAKEIRCTIDHSRLVWSSDGRVLCVALGKTVDMFDVASGTVSPTVILEPGYDPHPWAYNESFRVMSSLGSNPRYGIHPSYYESTVIDIFEVEFTQALTKIGSFSIQFEEGKHQINSFSPTTYRISGSIERPARLFVLDIRNMGKLLIEKGAFYSQSFSSDGSWFGAFRSGSIYIWNYDGSRYVPWRQVLYRDNCSQCRPSLFSPTSRAILVHDFEVIQLLRFDSLPDDPATHVSQLDIYSRSGTHIATARYRGKTVTITNVSRTTSQSIDAGFKITGLGLTGSVLLVKGPDAVVAWLLTEEGWVSNVPRNRNVGCKDSIWTMSISQRRSQVRFSVDGETATIKSGNAFHIYNSRTGEVFEPVQGLPHFDELWYSFSDSLQAQDYRRNNSMENAQTRDNWRPWTEGWLKDRHGKHLLWLPTEWRVKRHKWFPDVSTIKFKSRESKLVIIRLQ